MVSKGETLALSVGMHMATNAHKYYWYATAAAIANPATRRTGMTMMSWGTRVAIKSGLQMGSVILNTPFKAGGKTTLRTVGKGAARASAQAMQGMALHPATYYVVASGVLHYKAGQSMIGAYRNQGMTFKQMAGSAVTNSSSIMFR